MESGRAKYLLLAGWEVMGELCLVRENIITYRAGKLIGARSAVFIDRSLDTTVVDRWSLAQGPKR